MAASGTTRIARSVSRSLRLPALLAPLAVFGATLALYAATLTGVHTFDALSYILDVQRKPWRELFHPHHLAYGPLGWLVFHGAQALGYTGTANVPLQALNAVAGAAGVALFFSSLRRITGSAWIALSGAALLGLSYAFWYYAVEVEVYTLAALFLIACLDQIARLLERPSAAGFALLGLLHGLAILFHQTNVLLAVPVGVALLGCWRLRPASANRAGASAARWLWLLAYTSVLALTVGLPYLTVAALSDLASWQRLRGWLLSYAETGWWGGPITQDKWADLGEGLSLTVADTGGALIGLLLLGLLVLHSRSFVSRHLRGRQLLVLVAISWLLTYGAFFLWWEPDNIEFWIASLPPALVLLALALRGGERYWRRQPGLWLALSCALTMGVINSQAISLRGDPALDLQRQIVAALVAASGPDDLLLVPDGLQELYLPFYEGRFAPYSWNQAFYDHGPAWPDVCAAVRGRVDGALHAGAGVIFAAEVLNPPPLLQRRHNLSPEAVAACLAPYRQALEVVPMPAPQLPAWRIPAASVVAAGEGWRFTHFRWGWQPANLVEAGFVAGWQLIPGTDPALTSPLLSLDAARFDSLEVALAIEGDPAEAQLFWAGPDGQLAETRSLRWTLRPGLQTYRFDLRAQPGWQGTITRLRLDPVAAGDGRALRLVAVRLLPRPDFTQN